MRKLKAALVGFLLLLGTLLGGCAAPQMRTAADAPNDSPDVVMIISPAGYTCSAVVIEEDVLATAGHCLTAEVMVFRPGLPLVHETGAWVSDSSDIGIVFLEHKLAGVHRARIGGIPDPFAETWIRGFGCALHEKGRPYRLDTRPTVALGLTSAGQMGFLGSSCHGDSGGAYFDDEGRLLGVTSMGYFRHDTDVMSYSGSAAPISDALEGLMVKP